MKKDLFEQWKKYLKEVHWKEKNGEAYHMGEQ